MTSDLLEPGQDEPSLERPESVISSLSSASRPDTAPPAHEILEKDLLDAVCWRKQSIADKDILSLVFVMMTNSKGHEIVGEDCQALVPDSIRLNIATSVVIKHLRHNSLDQI